MHRIDARCLLLCWGQAGPVRRQLQAEQIECIDTVCQPSTEARIRWLLDELIRSPPDVFVPNLCVPALFAGQWVRSAGIPTIGVLHSDDDFYRGVVDEFVAGDPVRALTAAVCVSRELQRQLRGRQAPRTEIKRIAYGVPLPRETVHRQGPQLRVAYVGRLVERQKRISVVARALCRVAASVPYTRCSIIGDGPDRERVERILASDGSGLPVQLDGPVPSTRIQNSLLSQDVVVLLSDYEGLPIAILEAMACGCVPVCLRTRSGIPELVEHEVTGLVVSDGADALVDAIRRLQADPDLWHRLSNAARRRVSVENDGGQSAAEWSALLWSLHRGTATRREIQSPDNCDLPPVRPALAPEDTRRGMAVLPPARRQLRSQVISRLQRGLFGHLEA